MIKATTASGTYYLIDTENNKAQRIGEQFKISFVDGQVVPAELTNINDYFEGQMKEYFNEPEIEVGKPLYFEYWDGTFSISTAVQTIEEV